MDASRIRSAIIARIVSGGGMLSMTVFGVLMMGRLVEHVERAHQIKCRCDLI
jgi:hypothetical protein